MLVKTMELLTVAARQNFGVLAFNVIGFEHAEAIMLGAEAERSPVILQVSQNAIAYRLGLIAPIGRACNELAAQASVPVSLHLDHATTRDLCERAADIGFSSIMYDGSSLSYDDNVEKTAVLASWAHQNGIGIEGELGVVGGKDGVLTTPEGMTDPGMATRYVATTGVDALAVAVGSEHGMVERRARLDLDLIERLREAVPVPLVLHGSSGVTDPDLVASVKRGMTKINLATQLNTAFTTAIRSYLDADAAVVDPRRYGEWGRAAMVDVVRDRCRLVGSSGKAHDFLDRT
ncbi:MAG: class II fructose-bisphosphate aldolase [Thermomicrobiales bacterium]